MEEIIFLMKFTGKTGKFVYKVDVVFIISIVNLFKKPSKLFHNATILFVYVYASLSEFMQNDNGNGLFHTQTRV